MTRTPLLSKIFRIMVSIKLRRIGKKGQASFRIVVSETRSKADGKFIEDLGWIDPHTNKFELSKDRVEYWLSNGAQPTETAFDYIKKSGIELKVAR